MQRIGSILQRKFAQPRFKKMIAAEKLKKTVELFFLKKGLRVLCREFDEKHRSLSIITSHPGYSREVMGYQQELFDELQEKGIFRMKTIRTIVS